MRPSSSGSASRSATLTPICRVIGATGQSAHLFVNYVTGPPDEIELYQPYRNRECLYCHSSARSFEENDFHVDVRAALALGDVSCLECHAVSHDVNELASLPTWEPGP